MSIATEITRIQQAKADIKTAIQAKGVTVPSSAKIDAYDDYVSQISGGGGCEGFIGMVERSAASITIPSGTTKIGNYAFTYYDGLTSVNIPDTVTRIEESAFEKCSSLTSIDIPSGVTSIGDNAFTQCSSLTSIDLPDSVTSIGGSAFRYCRGLTSCTIGSGVTSIGQGAFYGCRKLTSVTLGTSVTSIDNYAFYECSRLTSITCLAATPPTLAQYGVFDNTNNCPIYVPSASVNAYKSATSWSTYASRIQAIP